MKSRAVAQWAEFLGKPVLLSMETRYFFTLYSIKTVDRSCSRKCGNGMIHCRKRESLFSSTFVFPRENANGMERLYREKCTILINFDFRDEEKIIRINFEDNISTWRTWIKSKIWRSREDKKLKLSMNRSVSIYNLRRKLIQLYR